MMPRILMLGGMVVGALLQQLLPGWAFLGGTKPPILLCLALYCALHAPPRDLWIGLFFAAVLRDGLDPGRFGPALLAFPAIGWAVFCVRQEVFVDGLVAQAVFGALGAMAATLVATVVLGFTGARPFHFGMALLRILGSGLLGMAALPLVSYAMGRLEAALPKRRGYGWQ